MNNRYGSNIDNILVGIGPSIGPCCYEIGRDLAHQFTNKYENYNHIIIERDNKVYLDLWKVNYLQIRDKGVKDRNIIVTKICTSCHNDKFYSYRKEKGGTKHRMIAAIGLISNLEGGKMSTKILVVDDEHSIVELLKYNLENSGYEVKEAYDGEEALNMVSQERFDLIILDLMLPKLME